MGKASNTIQVTHPNVRNHSASLYSDPHQKWKPSDGTFISIKRNNSPLQFMAFRYFLYSKLLSLLHSIQNLYP